MATQDNSIQTFSFAEGVTVRSMLDENNQPWFAVSDVCDVLGYANSRDALAKHCRTEGVAKRDTPTNSGNQQLTFINEGNLYRLIIKSRKPEAEKFEAWVCDEVLPTIRKTGSYTVGKPETVAATTDGTLTILEFKGKPLRVLHQDNIRWWVLPDVEAATDTQLSRALKRLTPDDLRVASIPGNSMDAYNRINSYTTRQHVVTDNGLKQLLGGYINAGVNAFLTWGKGQWLTRPDHRVCSSSVYDPNEFYLVHKSSLESGACVCTPNQYGTLTTTPILPESIPLLKAARGFVETLKQEGIMMLRPEDVLKKLAL